jgi:hypothetical protein
VQLVLDVGDPASNLWLNLCFWLILLVALGSFLPWRAFGVPRLSQWAKWSWLPVLMLAVAYEVIMPARFDIRVDLLLLLPIYALVVLACTVRWFIGRRGSR